MSHTTVTANLEAPGAIIVKNGSVTTLFLWAYAIESISESTKTPGATLGQLKSGTYFRVDTAVDAVVAAVSIAMQAWVREERLLTAAKAKAA